MKQKLYDLMDWEAVEAIVYADEDNPTRVLGPRCVKGGVLVQCFLPDAVAVYVKPVTGSKKYKMEKSDDEGMFAALLPGKKIVPYTYLVRYEDGTEVEVQDPYLYQDLLGINHITKFSRGLHENIYNYLGAHPVAVQGCMDHGEIFWDVTEQSEIPKKKKKKGPIAKATAKEEPIVFGTHFAVWAPNAKRVSVVGNFNLWDGRRHPMVRQGDTGVFALFIPGVMPGDIYKYEIKIDARNQILKSDPYGFAMEQRPANASKVAKLSDYKWQDEEWLKKREKADIHKEPMSIYEVHLGSWRKRKDNKKQGSPCEKEFLNYREIAPLLADYVLEMGYTHVELMPVMEHPLDESWGYQVTGYYAPTSRFGSPQDFMYFMDYMHQKGIGVFLDWVPAHFPKDENGLARFDGSCLYEHPDPRRGEHPHWGTLIYNYGRPEVKNFLIANAMYWVDKYHADGIRMDAVASILYLDYGKQDGQWAPNMYGGNENLEAIDFLRELSEVFHDKGRGALLIAEESTAWAKVTEPASEGGLGFDLKWNMGWMNDFSVYMKTDPLFRKGRHGMLTFSMIYAYSEKYVLVFSHDEVVHLKGSMLGKMPGSYEQKFANLRAAYGFMMTHPGKKLLFMGQDFAQSSEWNEKVELPWEELDKTENQQMQEYVKSLQKLYKENKALYEMDNDPAGFEWLSNMDADHSIISFMRYDEKKEQNYMVVCNFTPVAYENFRVGVPFAGKYKEIFNSDKEIFGGTGLTNPRQKNSKKISWDGRDNSLSITVPPLGISIFKCVPMDIA